ncbi:MAG: ribosome recycling factor [Candidatus Melainabacteria bacterium]|nr:ribosome recycling factor [Candidatus Melainabacteria bacterium]
MVTAQDIRKETETRMQKAVAATQGEMSKIRTGRANPMLLDRVLVDYYGAPSPLKQLANISVQEGTTLVIQPFDKTQIASIEKAITKADLGMSPNNDGTVIRLAVPPLSEERRKEMVKLVKKYGEEGKVAIRNIRRDAADDLDKLKKELNLSEDEVRREQDDLQKLTDRFIKEMDHLVADKEKDVLAV